MIGKITPIVVSLCKNYCRNMKRLPKTQENIKIINDFIDKTKKRISEGVDITFTRKAILELEELNLEYDINEEDIVNSILSLTTENYYRGVDPSFGADFNVCAFCVCVGEDCIDIYLKYGLEEDGLQILVFSNHVPKHPMDKPFKN